MFPKIYFIILISNLVVDVLFIPIRVYYVYKILRHLNDNTNGFMRF